MTRQRTDHESRRHRSAGGGPYVDRLRRRLADLALGRRTSSHRRLPVLVLTTEDARRRRPRRTRLLYVPDGDSYLVVGSNPGPGHQPGWLRDLEQLPDGRVRVGREVHGIRARVLRGPDADALWPTLVAHHPAWRSHEEPADREVPVVRLERRPSGGLHTRSSDQRAGAGDHRAGATLARRLHRAPARRMRIVDANSLVAGERTGAARHPSSER